MTGRLLIGMLCFVLGLVLIAAGLGVGRQTRRTEPVREMHWITAKLQPIESFQRVYVPATRSGRKIYFEHYDYVADLSFVTKDGKTIKVHESIPDYIVRIDGPLAIDYLEDDPYQTSYPHPVGLDIHGNKIDDDTRPARMSAEAEAAGIDQGATGLMVIGLCLALLGGAMVYSVFKS